MSHFLVFFSRGGSEPAHIEQIDDSSEALHRLLAAEKELSGSPTRGVVMLVADDEDELRRTHAHYFASVEELVRQAVG